ncbi:MAG: winged helix DNA-binding protein [Sedimentisphaerales bacterium]|nr:winged helix DNA-binding protein [Sedimentisphaerales bacterium]
MSTELEKAIWELTRRMRLLKILQQEAGEEDLTERDTMILGLLNERSSMTVSEVAAAIPNVSDSTISTNITRLWREKRMVSKTMSPQDQRTTVVALTDEGKKAIDAFNRQRTERFSKLFQALQVTDDEKELLLKIISRALKFFDKYLNLGKSTQ